MAERAEIHRGKWFFNALTFGVNRRHGGEMRRKTLQADIARALGISRQRVHVLAKRGMPVDDVEKARQWRAEHLDADAMKPDPKARAGAAAGDSERHALKNRLLAAEVQIREDKAKNAGGVTLPSIRVEKGITAGLQLLRAAVGKTESEVYASVTTAFGEATAFQLLDLMEDWWAGVHDAAADAILLGLQRELPAWGRGFDAMLKGGLDAGLEHEVCTDAARALGRPHDRNRVVVPWSAFQRDVSTTASGGGFLVEDRIPMVADLLRPWSVTLQAGITTIGNLRANAFIPMETAASSITWQPSETTQVSVSAPTVAQVPFSPKTARGVVQLSRQLMKQSDVENILRRWLLRLAGTIADTAVLNGSGTAGEPQGLLNISGLSAQTGTSLAWSGVLHMKKLAADANAVDADIAFISTPAIRETLEARVRLATYGSGFCWQDDRIANCPAYATTLMPAATMLSGPMSQVVFATWGGGIEVQLNPNDPTLFKSGVVQVAVVMSCDVGVICPVTAFTKSSSIT